MFGENIRLNVYNIGLTGDSMDKILKTQIMKGKIQTLNFVKIKNVCTAKDTINKIKQSPQSQRDDYKFRI